MDKVAEQKLTRRLGRAATGQGGSSRDFTVVLGDSPPLRIRSCAAAIEGTATDEYFGLEVRYLRLAWRWSEQGILLRG